MAEVKITYETLFDLLRREKNRNELQQLDATFFTDVVYYIKEKQSLLGHESTLSSRSEQEKTRIQLSNVRKILRELYELREKKIISLAMSKVRTGSNLIDTSALLEEEKHLFDDACSLMSHYKHAIVDRIIAEEMPYVSSGPVHYEEKETKREPEKAVTASDPYDDEGIKVKLLLDLPKFMGLDNKIYGPFKKDDVTYMPENMAMLLVKKSRASKLD